MANLNLPGPIAAYFAADRRDGAAVANCFTMNAVVRDEGQTHSGRATIRAWKDAATTKFSYVSEPFAAEQKDDRYVVTGRVTGNFPGSPVDLRFAFHLERGLIASLEIAP